MPNTINNNVKNTIENAYNRINGYQKNKKEVTANPTQPQNNDSITLTKEALELSKLEAKIKDTPIIDEEKVSRIKQSIKDGTYVIDPDNIAKRIMDTDFEFLKRGL